MSTHATVVFEERTAEPTVGCYIHSDGYPEHMIPLLQRFIREVNAITPRHLQFQENPDYLVAKFVVYMSEKLRRGNGDQLSFSGIGLFPYATDPDEPEDYLYRVLFAKHAGLYIRAFHNGHELAIAPEE